MNLVKLAQQGWAAAASAIAAVEKFVLDHTDPATHAALALEVAAVKQGASDAVSMSDGVFKQVADSSADSLTNVFNAGLVALGYAIGGAPTAAVVQAVEAKVLPYEIEGVHRLRDFIKGQADALALKAIADIAAAKTGHAIPPATPPAA